MGCSPEMFLLGTLAWLYAPKHVSVMGREYERIHGTHHVLVDHALLLHAE